MQEKKTKTTSERDEEEKDVHISWLNLYYPLDTYIKNINI